MKLVFCPECKDIINLIEDPYYRFCQCNKSYGRYINERVAEIGGKGIPFGICNTSFGAALNNQLLILHGFFYKPVGWMTDEDIIYLEDSDGLLLKQ